METVTCRVIRRGWTDTCRALEVVENRPLQLPPLLLSLVGGREHALEGHVLPETPREKEESRSLEPILRLLASLQLLAIYCVPLQAGRALNASAASVK